VDLLVEQPRVLPLLGVEAPQGLALRGVLQREGEHLGVDLHEVDHRGGKDLAARAVEGEQAQRTLAGEQRHHHARVPRGEVEHTVEGVAVTVTVIVLGEGPRPARRDGLANAWEAREVEGHLAHPLVRQGASRGAHHEALAHEVEDRREVIRRDPREPLQAAAHELVGVPRARAHRHRAQVPGDSRGRDDRGLHHPARCPTQRTEIPVPRHRHFGGTDISVG
jgi:hypothetical protein